MIDQSRKSCIDLYCIFYSDYKVNSPFFKVMVLRAQQELCLPPRHRIVATTCLVQILQFGGSDTSFLSFRAEIGSKRCSRLAVWCHGIALRRKTVKTIRKTGKKQCGYKKKLQQKSKVKLNCFEIENRKKSARKFLRSKIYC